MNNTESTQLPSLRTGNTFLLLAASQSSPQLLEHLNRLQRLVGGRPIHPLHFTVQRFWFNEEAAMQAFMADLKSPRPQGLARCQPFVFYATGLVPLFSEYRQARVLKWRILPSQVLTNFAHLAETLLARHGGKSFYPKGWQSDLVTALDGIDRVDLDMSAEALRIPEPLFTADRLIISTFTSEDDHQVLEEIPLKKFLRTTT